MVDTKISELPVATAIASPDIAAIVQGGVTKQADVSLFGASYRSTSTARVDPSGSDSTGAVGDLGKPFLTVQAAINAFEISPPVGVGAMIDIGNNVFTEDLTTSLDNIGFRGSGYGDNTQFSAAFLSLTVTKDDGVIVNIMGCSTNNGISGNITGQLEVYVSNGGIIGDVINTGGNLLVAANSGDGTLVGTVSAPGFNLGLYNFNNDSGSTNNPSLSNNIVVNSAGSAILAVRTRIKNIVAGDSLTLVDSRVTGTNAVAAENITQSDIMLNPAKMDFSTLPQETDDSGLNVGQAWIDTTAGLNIVKVKL